MVSRIGLHIDLLLCEVEVVACSALALSAAIAYRTKDLEVERPKCQSQRREIQGQGLEHQGLGLTSGGVSSGYC